MPVPSPSPSSRCPHQVCLSAGAAVHTVSTLQVLCQLKNTSAATATTTAHTVKHDPFISSQLKMSTDWYFLAGQPAPATHLAHPEGCAALRIVLVTVPRVSRSFEIFPDGFDPHLLQYSCPHSGVRPFHLKSTCLTQSTFSPCNKEKIASDLVRKLVD